MCWLRVRRLLGNYRSDYKQIISNLTLLRSEEVEEEKWGGGGKKKQKECKEALHVCVCVCERERERERERENRRNRRSEIDREYVMNIMKD